jgi:hypothetical protein
MPANLLPRYRNREELTQGLESVRCPSYHLIGAIPVDPVLACELADQTGTVAQPVATGALDLRCGDPVRPGSFLVAYAQKERAAFAREWVLGPIRDRRAPA